MEINLTFFITAVCSFVLSLYVFISRPQSKVNIAFSLMVFFYAIWVSSFLLFSTSNQSAHLIFWAKVMHVSASFVPVSFLYFSYFFPWQNPPNRKLINLILVSFPLVLTFLTVFTDIMFGNYNPSAISIGEKLTPNPAYSLYLIYYLIYVVLTVYNFVKKYRLSTGNQRKQVRYVLYSTCLATFFVVLATVILPISKIYSFVWTGPFYILFAILVATYAITKEELMDIRVLIGRTTTYVFVGILLVASFIGLNALQMPTWLITATNALLALLWAWGAHRLREFIQTPVDKWISWYKPDELINNIVRELSTVSEREEAFKIIAGQLKDKIKIKNVDFRLGEKVEHPYIIKTKDGLIIPLSSAEGPAGIIILGQKVSEDSYDKKDLAFFETLIIQAKAILDRVSHYETIKRDFESSQKKLYDTERVLARSEKIASMAHLIQEYNHEIRTPLTLVYGEVEALTDKSRDMTYLESFKTTVVKHLDRIKDIVETTLRLSKPREREEVELDLNRVIEDALKMFPPSGVHLIKELNPLPPIMGDKDDLQTVFVNLIKNAVEAMPDGGNLKISTFSALEDNEPVVYAEVSDTGVGIPAENMEKIFEPFFSTHVTKGRGLGLSIVFRIIREHLGEIDVKSKVGNGSTFKIQFKAIKK